LILRKIIKFDATREGEEAGTGREGGGKGKGREGGREGT